MVGVTSAAMESMVEWNRCVVEVLPTLPVRMESMTSYKIVMATVCVDILT